MSVVTKKGDRGKTTLCCGKIVSKDDARVEACGALDELCSFLGMSRSIIAGSKFKKILEEIQRDLFVIGPEIAVTSQRYAKQLKKRIDATYVKKLERAISQIEGKDIFEGRGFYLPGEDRVSTSLDVARTVARRAERRIVALKNKGLLRNRYILIYLNRLSDLLYLAARYHEKDHRKVILT
jgi:cob(I)alamin adenosyltransferase